MSAYSEHLGVLSELNKTNNTHSSPFPAFTASKCFCCIVYFNVIDQIDFLNEFLVTNRTSVLSIIAVDFQVHAEATSIFHSVKRIVMRTLAIEPFQKKKDITKNEVDYLHFATIITFVRSLGGSRLGMGASMGFEFDQIDELLVAIGALLGRVHMMDCFVALQYFLLAEHFRTCRARKLLKRAMPIIVSLV